MKDRRHGEEWICAGYPGEGMVNALLSAVMVARQHLRKQDSTTRGLGSLPETFSEQFQVSGDRLERSGLLMTNAAAKL